MVGAPRHGYGIVGEVEELSQGRVALKVGTVYGVLDRLVGDGLAEPDREEVAGLLWAAAYVALVHDHRRAARRLAAVALLGSAPIYVEGILSSGGAYAVSTWSSRRGARRGVAWSVALGMLARREQAALAPPTAARPAH